MTATKAKHNRGSKFVRVLILNITFVLFGLCAVASGTYAWFNSNHSVSVDAGTFSIEAPDGLNYDLYYLQQFNDEEGTKQYDGNYNTVAQIHSGYRQESDYPVFASVTAEGGQTAIDHLWPARKLTFAIAVTSGTLASFNLDSWSEVVSTTAMAKLTADGGYSSVHLSWAINIYGAAYNLNLGNDVPGALALGWSHEENNTRVGYKYLQKRDAFVYSQEETPNVDGSDEAQNVLTGAVPENANTVFFTIEFSNASSTWYSYLGTDEETDHYIKDSDYGNSNCYEGLMLDELKFGLA